MTSLLIAAFPVLVVIGLLAVLVFAFRLDRRMGRGPHSAGPRIPDIPAPIGQARTPWELKAIEDQLLLTRHRTGPVVSRYDLTATVNRLTVAAGLDDPGYQLPVTADEQQLAAAIARIEDQLGLAPLEHQTEARSRRGGRIRS